MTQAKDSFGSPPRVWGRRSAINARYVLVTVHPHACGDDAIDLAELFRRIGSPPRVWGRRQFDLDAGPGRRFTPTRVGTTDLWSPHLSRPFRFTPTRVGTTRRSIPWRVSRSVHPHACGDDNKINIFIAPLPGSPPRVWGRRILFAVIMLARRFTPTRVGTTGRRHPKNPLWPVHPHACGDDSRPRTEGPR